MWRDPIVEEIRAIRDSYAKQFNYNLDAIYRDLKEQQEKNDLRCISLPPRRVKYANNVSKTN